MQSELSKVIRVAFCGGLAGTANAWLCYAGIPIPVDPFADFKWHVIPAGAARLPSRSRPEGGAAEQHVEADARRRWLATGAALRAAPSCSWGSVGAARSLMQCCAD